MNKITKWVVGAVCAVALVTSAYAADTVATAKVSAPQVNASLFNAGEFGVSLGTGYTLDTSALFNDEYTFNLNAGAFWFPFRNVGFEAVVPFYQTKGVSVDEVQAGVVFRLPLAKTTPVFRNVAPYVGLGAVYNWDTEQDWAYVAKAGLDVRFNPKWGVFVEGNYRNSELDNWGDGQTLLVGGFKLVF